MHVRSVVTAAVYEKSLRLSTAARRDKTVGEIVNLMSNDAQILRDVVRTTHMVWSTPAQIIVATALIYIDLGVSVAAGMLFMIILLPISGFLASRQKSARVSCRKSPCHLSEIMMKAIKIFFHFRTLFSQASQMKDKDNRIKIMNEILSGIRVLKLYAWELGFKKVVDAVRAQELLKLRKIAYLQAFLTMLWFFAPFAVSSRVQRRSRSSPGISDQRKISPELSGDLRYLRGLHPSQQGSATDA